MGEPSPIIEQPTPNNHESNFPEEIAIPVSIPKRSAAAKTTILQTNTGSYDAWIDSLWKSDSKIGIILGKRGEGKTAYGMSLLEKAYHHAKGKNLYAMGVKSLPDFITPVDDIKDLQANSIVLIDESGITFNSRDSMSEGNKLLGNLLKVARHKDLTVIFISQNSSNMDIDIIRQADFFAMKRSSLFQKDFERKQIGALYEKLQPDFAKYADQRGLTYIHSNEFTGFVNESLPSFWNEDISKSFAEMV